MDRSIRSRKHVNTYLYACGNGHVVRARDGHKTVDMTGFFCPVCLGRVDGYGDIIDNRILAPKQRELNSQ